MKLPKTKTILLVVATALLTFAVLSPMITFPGTSSKPTSICGGSELGEIKELERYGTVIIKYEEPTWSSDKPKGSWETSFRTSYKQNVSVSAYQRGHTLCESVDTLYYEVMQHPMKPVNDE